MKKLFFMSMFCITPITQASQEILNALRENNKNGIKLLLDAGTNVNIEDEFGRTALHHCLSMRKNDV